MSEPAPELIARCQKGDRSAFAELARQVQGRIYNLAYGVLRSHQEAQDATQEVLLRVWRALPSFRGDSQFGTWLHRIAVNASLNRRRKLRPELYVVDGEDVLATMRAPAADPQAQTIANDRNARVWAAVERLPTKYRLVITLFYQEQLSYQEIAEVLSLPLGTVKAQLNRARNALAEYLHEFGGES